MHENASRVPIRMKGLEDRLLMLEGQTKSTPEPVRVEKQAVDTSRLKSDILVHMEQYVQQHLEEKWKSHHDTQLAHVRENNWQ